MLIKSYLSNVLLWVMFFVSNLRTFCLVLHPEDFLLRCFFFPLKVLFIYLVISSSSFFFLLILS